MIYIPEIGSSDLVLVVWSRDRRILWCGGGKGSENS